MTPEHRILSSAGWVEARRASGLHWMDFLMGPDRHRIRVDYEVKLMRVYDILDCGENHRFALWNGHRACIVHNCTQAIARDILCYKSKKNEGELPQYRIQNSHPAIVTEEQWELVQLEIERRARMGNRFSAKGPMASRLVCADCGGFFGAKTWHSTNSYRRVVWRCNDKYNPTVTRASGGKKCTTAHVTEEQVYEAFGQIVSEIIEKRPMIIETWK